MTVAQAGPAFAGVGPAAVPSTGSTTASEPAGSVAARSALRRFASGVSVLTIRDEGVRRGATVSALVPVSREPLVVAVCLRTGSRFGELLTAGVEFSVNVLASDQAGIAERFANPRRPTGDAQFAGVSWASDPITDAPLLDGCLAHLACRVDDRLGVGDHDLVLAEVLSGSAGYGFPLLTFAGRLHAEAAEILL